jgi:hypothetical protein
MLNVMAKCRYAEYNYAECCYAECRRVNVSKGLTMSYYFDRR